MPFWKRRTIETLDDGLTFIIPAVDIGCLSNKSGYRPWARGMMLKLRSLGYVESEPGALVPQEPKDDMLRADYIAIRLLYVHISPRLFESRDLQYTQYPSELWLWWLQMSSLNDMIPKTSSLVDVKKAVKEGCINCHTILLALEAFSPGFIGEEAGKSISIRQIPGPTTDLTLSINDSLSTNWSAAMPPLFIRDSYTLDAVDEYSDCWTFAIHWAADRLRTCTCPPLHRGVDAFTPLRLVKVGLQGEDPCLVEGMPPGTSYCALSYCWGDSEGNLRTTSANLQEHLRRINITKAPKTLLDALAVCKQLCIRYIWIDSLCIVQDDIGHNDWKEQCSKMAQIYANAHLIIAVQSASDCRDGFLVPPKELTGRTSKFSTVDALGAIHEKVVGEKLLGLHDDPKYLQMRTPLSRRAWTFQETLLARRILHFTQTEVVWECRERIECWCQRLHHPTPPLVLPQYGSSYSRNVWQEFVGTFSNRSLSNPEDKFPAMAAIVWSLVMRWDQRPADFLAGLWKHDLARGLLWFAKRAGSRIQPPTFVAPTWSWASMDSSVGYPSFSSLSSRVFSSSINILETQIAHASPDSFGQISGGKVTVEGLLAPVELVVVKGTFRKSRGEYNGSQGRPIRVHDGQTAMVRRSPAHTYEILCDERLDEHEYICDEEDEECWLSGSCQYPKTACGCGVDLESPNFYCLKIGSLDSIVEKGLNQGETLRQSHNTQAWWLVLRRSSTHLGTFERIGLGCRSVPGQSYCQLFNGCEMTAVTIT
ncbi:Fc.00g107280.m01.CDS01 [Cosmosporella sp. VM-42]